TENIKCLGYHGEVNAQKIIKYSCNAGAAYASETVSSEAFFKMLLSFGFGQLTNLPLTGETYGLLREPKYWSYRSKPTIAFGQELSISAIQMISAATVFANHGVLLKPHIVRKIVSPEGKVLKEYQREPVREVLSPQVVNEMLLMMETAVEPGGTASRAAADGIRISAKTGTAEMLDKKTGKYSEQAYIASCLALLPTEDPQIIIYIVIENPKGSEHYGGRIAAPIIKEAADEITTYLGIPRQTDTVINHSGKIILNEKTLPEIKDVMPDLTGYSKREIMALFANKDIKLQIDGEGWVVSQQPEPGTAMRKGMTITLRLQ
ncbi:MAG: penicillin-binding transpeptidase domain-containing protein, partial [Spirochaetota bacterium]